LMSWLPMEVSARICRSWSMLTPARSASMNVSERIAIMSPSNMLATSFVLAAWPHSPRKNVCLASSANTGCNSSYNVASPAASTTRRPSSAYPVRLKQ